MPKNYDENTNLYLNINVKSFIRPNMKISFEKIEYFKSKFNHWKQESHQYKHGHFVLLRLSKGTG